MASTDIKLKKDFVPSWPNRCVVCDRDVPGHTVDLATFQVTWWSTLLLKFGKREKFGVPACIDCARRLVWERRVRFVIASAFVVAAMFVLPKVFGLPPGKLRTPALIGYGFIGVIPGTLIAVFFPPALDVTSHSDSVWYEFRSPAYAAEFAERNAAGVLDVID